MYMKSLVSLAVLGAMSAVATAGDLVVFDNPNESYTVDRLSKYGATNGAPPSAFATASDDPSDLRRKSFA